MNNSEKVLFSLELCFFFLQKHVFFSSNALGGLQYGNITFPNTRAVMMCRYHT